MENSTATGYSNNTIKQKRSKTMDMLFLGYNATNGNANSSSTGNQAARTSAIIIPSITLPVTIDAYDLTSSSQPGATPLYPVKPLRPAMVC
jgi:hypothetical protein